MKLSLVLIFLFSIALQAEERAPQGEPPYPEYPQPRPSDSQNSLEKPKAVQSDGTYIYDTEKKVKAPKSRPGVERPERVGTDGSYYYNTDNKYKEPVKRSGVPQPSDKDDDGTYYYSRDKNKKSNKKRQGIENPSSIESDGTYVYGDKESEDYNSTFYFNLGALGPFDWQGTTPNSLSYKDVYSTSPNFLLAGGYEWKMFDFLGSFLVRIDSGIMFAEGKGQFNGANNVNQGLNLKPKEAFQLYLFPNTFSVVYKFESSPSQYLIPYVSGGLGYYTFWERRTDNKKNSFGGATVTTVSGGLLVSLKAFNKLFGTGSIDTEYGISQSWLNLQYRRVIGLDARKDFSSNMFLMGVAFGF